MTFVNVDQDVARPRGTQTNDLSISVCLPPNLYCTGKKSLKDLCADTWVFIDPVVKGRKFGGFLTKMREAKSLTH